MGDAYNYEARLKDDTPEQFKDKPNINVLRKALAKQLAELHEFYTQLGSLRWFDTATGSQLDGIGDIVALSRSEAFAISEGAGKTVPLDDNNYKRHLKWKLATNTSCCTHAERHSAMKMFWDKTPLYYSEDPEHPATIFITSSKRFFQEDVEAMAVASKIKAAGIALTFLFSDDEYITTDHSGGAVVDTISEVFYAET